MSEETPNYNIPEDPDKLFKCSAIRSIAVKARLGRPLKYEEAKLLAYSFTFLGVDGRKKLFDVVKGCPEETIRMIEHMVVNIRLHRHLPVSCARVKRDWLVCRDLSCLGRITPLQHCLGFDPNLKLVKQVRLDELHAGLINKYVKVDAQFCGMGKSSSQVPYTLVARCVKYVGDVCGKCRFAQETLVSLSVLRDDLRQPNLLLSFCDVKQAKAERILHRYVQRFVEINGRCAGMFYPPHKPKIAIRIQSGKIITPLYVLQPLDSSDPKHVTTRQRTVYYLGADPEVNPGDMVRLVGRVLEHPRTAKITFFVTVLESLERKETRQ